MKLEPYLQKACLLAALAVCAIGAAACGSGSSSGSSSGGSKTKVAVVAGGPNAYFHPWGPAVKAAIKDFHIKGGTYAVPPTATFELSVENSTIDSLASKGYNAFAIFPDDQHGTNAEMAKLKARNIPSIALAGCTATPSPALMCLGTNVQASAYQETKILIKAIGGKGNIAFLTGLLVDPNTQQREAGVKQAVAQTGGKVKLVQTVADIDTPSKAPAAIQSLLASKASTLDGMLSTDYYPSVAAASIFTDNPKYRHIKFIGQDNNPTVMQAIKKHYIYGTMYQNSYGQAYIASYVLNKVVSDGCKIKPNAPWQHNTISNRYVDSGYFFVGQKDVDKFIGKPETIPGATKKLMGEMPRYLSCGS